MQGGIGQTTVETIASLLTVPLPFMLNIYWFKMIVAKGMRLAKGGESKKAE